MPVIENEDGILVINPGSLTYPRQRGRRPSYAVMQIEEGKDPQVEIRSVSYTHLFAGCDRYSGSTSSEGFGDSDG